MRPLLAMIALGTVLGAAGAGVVVGHAAASRPVVNDTSIVEQRIDDIGQQIVVAHSSGALDFSQAHAIDRELFEVRGREHPEEPARSAGRRTALHRRYRPRRRRRTGLGPVARLTHPGATPICRSRLSLFLKPSVAVRD